MNYFISDVHLGLYSRTEDTVREQMLLNFLDKISDNAKNLFIVGDLFDYWFEYKFVIPKYYYRILSKLKELRLKDIKIEYLMGNHDFGHQNFFQEELDIPIYKDDIVREIEGKKFYISHGDGKNYNDKGYKILKKILRNPTCQWLFNQLHPDFGIWLASHSSKKSRNYTSKKNWNENDGMEDFAKSIINEGFDYVITGHRHKATFKKIGNGYFVDLGDWLNDNPTFGIFENNEFNLTNYYDFMK